MSDYISREAAEILMCDACGFACKHYKRVSGQSLITADDCYHLHNITNVPAADVVEVRHGHWVRHKEYNEEYDQYDEWCECSECGCGATAGPAFWDNETPYCPNCGARMDESEEEE